MDKKEPSSSYNERLFSSGPRSIIHMARFRWLSKKLDMLNCKPGSVIELGCFDGKTIHFLPQKPGRYVGFDANWEGGLDLAKEIWQDQSGFDFIYCTAPEDITLEEHFEICICMETLEHVPPAMVEPYLEKLAKITDKYIFITVPNEKGLVFTIKHLTKKLLLMKTDQYSLAEFLNTAIGRMEKVRRHEHKGFDYEDLISVVCKYFQIIDISPCPFPWTPRSLGFGICLVGEPINDT